MAEFFQQAYEDEKLINFLRNDLLPEDFLYNTEPLEPEFKTVYIKSVRLLGKSQKLGLTVLEIRHESENDPRISLARETFRLMAAYSLSRTLVFFVSEKSPNYRLSLITLDTEWNEKKVSRVYSNPKRYSFFLGPDSQVHTPHTFLIKKGRVDGFDELLERFSIEVVNKQFYQKISMAFTRLAGGTRLIKNKTISEEGCLKLPSTIDNFKKQEFTVRLIGRLLFCWFLRKKQSVDNLALIPNELLSSNSIQYGKNYYHDVLENLFFQVLNTPMPQRGADFKLGLWKNIPFLNGGLFEPHKDDFYGVDELGFSKHFNTLVIPNDWVKDLFEIFETYNFTIDENTSFDVELAIEPEMLGRIFENLLAEINPDTGQTARKNSGSYYTPRPIVDYMVDESLRHYLTAKTKLQEKQIDTLLRFEDDSDDLSEAEKKQVLDALDRIKIIDPACGSGAFPMGILQKMLQILQRIDPKSEKWLDKKLARVGDPLLQQEMKQRLKDENWDYLHKIGLIQNSIYGIDIQPIAVEIAKLRFFLSLIVEEKIDDSRPNRGIQPLPNLDFKIVCANTLVKLPDDPDAIQGALNFGGDPFFDSLKEVLRDFFRVSDPRKKIQLRESIKELVDKKVEEKLNKIAKLSTHSDKRFSNKMAEKNRGVISALNRELELWSSYKNIFNNEPVQFFDTRYFFPEVTKGFDVVLANPPYVRHESFIEDKPYYKNTYPEVFTGKADLYTFFIQKGFTLLRPGGVFCYIVANKWMRADYGKPLRSWLSEQRIKRMIDFGDLEIFKSATTYPCILMLEKQKPDAHFYAVQANSYDFSDLQRFVVANSYQIEQPTREGESWSLSAPETQRLLEKLNRSGVPLGEYVDGKVYYGIKTGFNKAFVIDAVTRDSIIASDPKSAEVIKPFLAGKDIKRYQVLKAKKYLIFTRRGIDIGRYPAIKAHLLKFKKQLMPKPKDWKGKGWPGRKAGSYKWYEIQDSIAYYEEFEKDKIVYPNILQQPEFSIDRQYQYTNQKCFIIPGRNLHLLGILNSKLCHYLFCYILPKLRGDFFEPSYVYFQNFPVVPALNNQRKLEMLVEMMLDLNKELSNGKDLAEQQALVQKITETDREVDRLVYELYELTPDEIELVERTVGGLDERSQSNAG